MSTITPGFYTINSVYTGYYLLEVKDVTPNTDVPTQKDAPSPDESTFSVQKSDSNPEKFYIYGRNNATPVGPGDDGRLQWKAAPFGWTITGVPGTTDDYEVEGSSDANWFDEHNDLYVITIQGKGSATEKYHFRFSKV